MTNDVLRLDKIFKTYPGVTALSDVSFAVRAGEVHALVGENGAGKSTLMGVAAGVVQPDSGSVEIAGTLLVKPSPSAAQMAGLAVVYQHSTVLDDLTVAENLIFSLPEDRRPSNLETNTWVRNHLAAVGADVSPRARADELSIAQRQLVEIARALALQSKVLILDEPTESLTANESEKLFEQIERLRAAGTGIVYISHRFPEVQRIANRITVLRDGQVRGSFDAAGVTEEDVLQLIVGREVEHVFPVKLGESSLGKTLFEVTNLSSSRFSGVNVAARSGEIIGLAGVEGNGQREFLRALVGLHPYQGDIRIAGDKVDIKSPSAAARTGIVHLPGDRHIEGAFLPLTVRENISTLVLNRFSRAAVIKRKEEGLLARESVEELRIRTPGIETPVASLSGGNQQKVLFARSLAANPIVLIADEPTRGVDVGARAEIYRLLRSYAEAGHVVIVLSTDAIELAGLCDRVLVFSRGSVVRQLQGGELSEREITGAAITADEARSEQSARRSKFPKLGRLLRGDYFPSSVLAAIILLLGFITSQKNSFFLGPRSVSGTLLLASILILTSVGQLTVLVAGSIDLSVGPLIGLTVVLMSFFATNNHGVTGLVEGAAVALFAGAVVGVVNALGVRLVKLPPVISTLVMYIFLQGLALVLRPTPNGYIDSSTTKLLTTKLGVFPIAVIVAVVIALVFERLLRRNRLGVELRAVGSSEVRAVRLGARINATIIWAHVICSLLAVLAGLVLSSLVGVGQSGLGSQYTLTSITAVVLGGASIFGGRGSYLGALLGAFLIQEIISATSFLGLETAWQQWLPGLLILGGAALFSRARSRQ